MSEDDCAFPFLDKDPSGDLADQAGRFADVILPAGKRISVFVVPVDSDAKRAGYDVMAACCSLECCVALAKAWISRAIVN